jgi:hypothetical protein
LAASCISIQEEKLAFAMTFNKGCSLLKYFEFNEM